MLRGAYDRGVTFFDTAEMYGPFLGEKQVGAAFKGMRDKVAIATKFGFKIDPANATPGGVDSRPAHIREVCRGFAGAVADRSHRPALPAPARSRSAGRGCRRHGARPYRRGQSAPLRHVGGRCRIDPPRPCGLPGDRAAERVFAVDPRCRGGNPAHAEGTRHRLRPVQPAGPRLPHRPGHARDDPRGRLAREHGAVQGRSLRPEPGAGRGACRRWRRRRATVPPSWRSPGCSRRARTSCRSPVRGGSNGSRKTSPRRTSS